MRRRHACATASASLRRARGGGFDRSFRAGCTAASAERSIEARGRPPLKEERAVKCQCCSKPATVHLTDIVDGHKKELHLCQACAEQQQILKHQELNLPAILQTLIGQHVGAQSDELARLTCPV